MKKKRTARMAVGVIIATLLTTSLIGGTFAKYTAAVEGGNTAKVAYWGFENSGTLDFSNLFSSAYDNVESYAGENIIAPGTTGYTEFSFPFQGKNISGGPEVAYTFTVSVEGECDDSIKENPQILFQLDDGQFGTFDDLLAAIKLLSGDESGTKQYAAGELPTAFSLLSNTHKITWKWNFTDTSSAEAEVNQDYLDTDLGCYNYDDESEPPQVELSVTITATQID